ncbi:MAG: hypothetical protein Q8S13_09165 [Dehalococcoidia bacterium]|nr:hypothetical protein [Dehalococcoidia bacterium]
MTPAPTNLARLLDRRFASRADAVAYLQSCGWHERATEDAAAHRLRRLLSGATRLTVDELAELAGILGVDPGGLAFGPRVRRSAA